MPLVFESVIGETKVMKTLFAVAELSPALGLSMKDTFSPGKLRPDEVEKWNSIEERATK
jgi:hypothetical protein